MLVIMWASLFLSVSGQNDAIGNDCVNNCVNTVANIVKNTVANIVNNTVGNTVNNTVGYTVGNTFNQSNPAPNCVKSTDVGHKLKCLLHQLFLTVQQPEVIIAFLTGILLTATICCLSRTCHRRKRKSENLDKDMEMAPTETVQLVSDGQAVECDDGTHGHAAEAAGTLKEVEYSNIVFFASRSDLTEDRDTQQPTETEYAEIKRDPAEKRQDGGGERGEVLEDNREEEEIGLSVLAEEEGGEDGGVYSTMT